MKRRFLPQNQPTARPRSCRGFTLIELLTVMAIIALLVSITTIVLRAVLGSARSSRTKATIRKVDGLLTKRMEAFTRAMQDQNASPQPRYIYNASLFPAALTPLSGNITPVQLAAGNIPKAKVLGQKALFRAGFPQNLSEIFDASLLGGNTNTPSEADSSEAMYIFLTKMESIGLPAVDEDAFDSSDLGDTDGDGLKEFVDGWGNPLRFYRWPTRLIRPSSTSTTAQGLNKGNYTIPVKTTKYLTKVGLGASIFFGTLPDATSLARDPDDPLGLTQKATWGFRDPASNNRMMSPGLYESAPTTGFGLPTPETWSVPLIVSAGPDGELGLYENTDTANFGHLAQPRTTLADLEKILDNISNRNMAP